MPALRSICVFCGASGGRDPSYAAAAAAVGTELARRGIELVYGDGRLGLMGVVADAALAAGGRVTGVIPTGLVDRELAHPAVSELRIVATLHERKAVMAELADAFIALPGGAGTLEELIEVFTWSMLGLHAKPLGVLNVNGYYDGLAALLDNAVRQDFLRPEHRAALHTEATPGALLERFDGWRPSTLAKWL